MLFAIVDGNDRNVPRIDKSMLINASNGKRALELYKLQNALMGGLEIHKNARAKRWIMSSSYGAFFVAMPIVDGILKIDGYTLVIK